MFFKPNPPKHNLPYQFFFHKDSRFHPICGKLLVTSRAHDLKNEVIDFSIVGLGKCSNLDVAMIDAIFEEARYAGYKPHALLAFSASVDDMDRTYPDQHNGHYLKAKRLTKDLTNPSLVQIQVRDYRNDRVEFAYAINVHQLSGESGDPFVTPEFVGLVFEYVKAQGLVPLDLLKVGNDPALENTVSDLPAHLFQLNRTNQPDEVSFDDSQTTQWDWDKAQAGTESVTTPTVIRRRAE